MPTVNPAYINTHRRYPKVFICLLCKFEYYSGYTHCANSWLNIPEKEIKMIFQTQKIIISVSSLHCLHDANENQMVTIKIIELPLNRTPLQHRHSFVWNLCDLMKNSIFVFGEIFHESKIFVTGGIFSTEDRLNEVNGRMTNNYSCI